MDRSLGVTRKAWIVGHHADRRAALVQLAEESHDCLAVLRVEVSRRLVGEEDQRLARYGPRDGDALLLAARELRGIMLDAVRHAHTLERLLHPLAPLGRRHPAVGERQLDVLVDGEVTDQVEGLEDESDLAVPDARAVAR